MVPSWGTLADFFGSLGPITAKRNLSDGRNHFSQMVHGVVDRDTLGYWYLNGVS